MGRGLLKMVGSRRRLLTYLKRTDLPTYRSLIAEVRYLGGTTAVTQSVRDAVAAILDQ